jgi:hypothetical protein
MQMYMYTRGEKDLFLLNGVYVDDLIVTGVCTVAIVALKAGEIASR